MKKIILIIPIFLFFGFVSPVLAAGDGDLNGDNKVDIIDLRQGLLSFPGIFSLNLVIANFGKTYTPAPTPTPPSPGNSEWTQLAHDAQRTGYTDEEPGGRTWSFAWHWTPDDMFNVPSGSNVMAGGNFVYLPAGNQGLYAVRKDNGQLGWRVAKNFTGAPAFDPNTGYLYAGSTDGNLYKINAGGQIVGTYQSGSSIDTAVLLVADFVYVANNSGQLHKVATATMTKVWQYDAGSRATTPASYSSSRDILIFGTQDLKIYAVNNSNGSVRWAAKPTSLNYGDCQLYSYEFDWPVVADLAGVVLVRMRLGNENEWFGYSQGPMSRYPVTNADIKALLESDPHRRSLFALDLDTGQNKFTPAVANGARDDTHFTPCGGSTGHTIAPMPAVKTIGNSQVAYTTFRSGDVANSSWDGRWDSHMGEMILDGQDAGNVRFVSWQDVIGDGLISDEQSPVSVAGNTIFYAHWGYSESQTVLDRSAGLGLTRSNPITTRRNPPVIRKIKADGSPNTQTHWTEGGLELYCDGRYLSGPGFWIYWNEVDPPQECADGSTGPIKSPDIVPPRYTFASGGMIYVIGVGGDIFALKYN